jgi:hypothetical protein
MPDFIRLNAPAVGSTAPTEYLVRASDVLLITYDVMRDTTTLTLRDVGQLNIAQGPDEIETLLTDSPVATAQNSDGTS